MKHIVIVVEGGLVQTVFSNTEDVISIEVIDFDTEDPDELDAEESRLNAIKASNAYRAIY